MVIACRKRLDREALAVGTPPHFSAARVCAGVRCGARADGSKRSSTGTCEHATRVDHDSTGFGCRYTSSPRGDATDTAGSRQRHQAVAAARSSSWDFRKPPDAELEAYPGRAG